MENQQEITLLDLEAMAASATTLPASLMLNTQSDYRVRMAVFDGTNPWHYHPNSSEMFIVLSGQLTLDFRDRESLTLKAPQSAVVPQSVIHRSRTTQRTLSLSVEAANIEVILL